MAARSSFLIWKIPSTEEPWQAAVHGAARVGHILAAKPPPPISQVGQTHQDFVVLKNL